LLSTVCTGVGWLVGPTGLSGWFVVVTLTLFLVAIGHLGLPVAGLLDHVEGQTRRTLNFFQTRLGTSTK